MSPNPSTAKLQPLGQLERPLTYNCSVVERLDKFDCNLMLCKMPDGQATNSAYALENPKYCYS